MIEFTVPT